MVSVGKDRLGAMRTGVGAVTTPVRCSAAQARFSRMMRVTKVRSRLSVEYF